MFYSSVTLFFCCSSLIFSALVATSLAFGCFSGAALVSRRREYLYLGGLVSSGLSILLWLHFASSIFGGSTALFKFEVSGYHYFHFCENSLGHFDSWFCVDTLFKTVFLTFSLILVI